MTHVRLAGDNPRMPATGGPAASVDLDRLRAAVRRYVGEFLDGGRRALRTADRQQFELLRVLCRSMLREAEERHGLLLLRKMQRVTLTGAVGSDTHRCLLPPRRRPGSAAAPVMGEGAQGRVYRVSGRVVAKVSKLSSGADGADMVARVQREFDISRRAGRLGVGPRVSDTYVCCDDEACYSVIYMDLLRGATLSEWQRSTPPPAPAEIAIARRLFAAKMRLLHANGIIHRDVHAGNVILTFGRGGRVADVFVLDFGLSAYRDGRFLEDEQRRDLNPSLFDAPRATEAVDRDYLPDYVFARLLDAGDVVVSSSAPQIFAR